MLLPHRGIEWIGLVGTAFLGGVFLHSVRPAEAVSMAFIAGITAVATGLIFLGWRFLRMRWIGLCVLGLIAGIWRFEMARPTMPRGLVFGSARGLAYVATSVRTSDASDPRYWLGRVRRTLTARAQERFSADESALLTGILYGERAFSLSLKERFRRAGLLHLVAVSGSNVTIIAVVIMHFFLWFRFTRRAAFAVLALVLLIFVLFVNPSASVVRAAIMGLLAELAPLFGRLARPSRLLLISAVVFVLWKPWTLVFDPSFALSFFAMWGLLTWGIWLDHQLVSIIPFPELRAIFAATVGATFMTMPYTAWAFDQVSVWGLLTSLIALPLVPWVMSSGMLALILPATFWITLPAQGFLQLVLWSARLPEFFSVGIRPHVSITWQTMAAIYIVLFFLWRLLHAKNKLIHFSRARKMIPTSVTSDVSDE